MSLTLSSLLSVVTGLGHGFTNRTLPESEIAALAARAQLLKQVHGDKLHWAESLAGARPEADAIATFTPGLVIAVQSADCVPILVAAYDDEGRAGALLAIHAGWRGTSLGIAGSALRAFVTETRARGELPGFAAAVGPCISRDVYEVGEEVADKFPPAAARFLKTENGARKYLLDVESENVRQLEAAAAELGFAIRIDRLRACTYSQPALYPSYRRDGARPDRILSFLELLP